MIDHLVYCCHDIDGATRYVEGALGVTVSPGGRHLNRGTLNRLLRIGPRTYLELLAVDPANHDVPSPRWMGVDLLPKSVPGQLTRWAIAVNAADPPRPAADPAPFKPGQRQLADGTLLRWRLTDPGIAPLVDPNPFFIDWLGQPPPAERLPDQACVLTHLSVGGEDTQHLVQFSTGRTQVEAVPTSTPFLKAFLQSPKGRIVLT